MKDRNYKLVKTLIVVAIFAILFIAETITAHADDEIEVEPIGEYGPAFFIEHPEISVSNVITSEDGMYIVGVKEDENLVQQCSAEPVLMVAEENTKPDTPSNRWGITMTQEEKDVLAQIVFLESGNQSDLGQQAVVEVVFNRVVSGNFSNSVIGVLSEKRQFTTWKYRHKGTPTLREYANIEAVLNGQTNIFPFKTVYFSRGAQNKRVQQRIGGHVFCNEK